MTDQTGPAADQVPPPRDGTQGDAPSAEVAEGEDPSAVSGDGADTEEAALAHDRRRRRTPLRVLGIGAAVSLLVALGTGLVGLPGALAGAVFLSLLALSSGVAGAWLSVGVVLDQWRGRHVSTARVLLAGASLLLTLALLVASAGAFLGAVEAGP